MTDAAVVLGIFAAIFLCIALFMESPWLALFFALIYWLSMFDLCRAYRP